MDAGLNLGPVTVITTTDRGHTPEEVAMRCLNRIISVSDSAPDVIREQARAYRDFMYKILVQYMHEVVKSDRTTLCAQLTKQGHEEVAELIRRL